MEWKLPVHREGNFIGVQKIRFMNRGKGKIDQKGYVFKYI